MKFTQEERAAIHKLLVINRNAELSRAAANMIFFGSVSSGLEVELNEQANIVKCIDMGYDIKLKYSFNGRELKVD